MNDSWLPAPLRGWKILHKTFAIRLSSSSTTAALLCSSVIFIMGSRSDTFLFRKTRCWNNAKGTNHGPVIYGGELCLGPQLCAVQSLSGWLDGRGWPKWFSLPPYSKQNEQRGGDKQPDVTDKSRRSSFQSISHGGVSQLEQTGFCHKLLTVWTISKNEEDAIWVGLWCRFVHFSHISMNMFLHSES